MNGDTVICAAPSGVASQTHTAIAAGSPTTKPQMRIRQRSTRTVSIAFGLGSLLHALVLGQTQPCDPSASGPVDSAYSAPGHGKNLAQRGMPVIPNPVNGSTRLYPQGGNGLVPAPGNADPCRARFNVYLQQNGRIKWGLLDGSADSNALNQMLPWGPNPSAAVRQFFTSLPNNSTRGELDQIIPFDPVGSRLPWLLNEGGDGADFGFRLGFNSANPLSIGDFLPPATTIGASSVALLPPGAASNPTGWNGLSRPILEGSVDLITGLPLAQFTDLELPFDGATFRLTRTRSHRRAGLGVQALGSGASDDFGGAAGHTLQDAGGNWWDWAGLGWMVGESPILLIDSALPDIEGDGPRTTRLVLDAHHSIPFQRIESSGRYEAPARFRATLVHNGQLWNEQTHDWGERPTQFTVSLYDGEVTYTFAAIYDDVPDKRWAGAPYLADGTIPDPPATSSNYHDRPLIPDRFTELQPGDPRFDHMVWDWKRNPGFGLPHYGICTKITDRNNHTVEISYIDTKWRAMDDRWSPDCVECWQDALGKGQIRSISLKAGGTTHWTLVYTYRRFAGLLWDPTDYDLVSSLCPEGDPDRYEVHGYNAIDRIYVYQGGMTPAEIAEAPESVHHTDTSMWDLDFVNGPRNQPIASKSWTHQVRYHYAANGESAVGQFFWDGIGPNRATSPPVLQVTSSATRDPNQPESVRVRHHVFQYDSDSQGGAIHIDAEGPFLTAIFNPDDVDRALLATQLDPDDGSCVGGLGGATSFAPVTLRQLAAGISDPTTSNAIRRRASVWFGRSDGAAWPVDPGASGCQTPSSTALLSHGYLRLEAGRLAADVSTGVVRDLSVHDALGTPRYFRIHRLIYLPDDVTVALSDGFNKDLGNGDYPMASRWFIPYAWQGYSIKKNSNGFEPSRNTIPVLTQPRYVSIIDEYESRAAMQCSSVGYAADAGRPGLKSRRVVELNAAGVTLRERKWTYNTDGTVNASGGGLGEEYIYTTTLRFLQEHGLVATEPPPPDPVAMGATDLLLLQHRSVGWSATTLNTPDGEGSATEGLVNFFEYQYIAGTQNEISASRVQLIAEGVQKGKGDSSTPPDVKYYTRQIFRAADHPTDVTHEVTFTEPQASLLAAAPSDPPSTTTCQPPYRVTYFHTEYEAGTTADPDAPRRALWRRVIGPPHKQRPEAGAEWYYPIEREDYDQYGNMSWSATGLVSNPLDPMSTTANDLSSLILTYYDRDANGRSRTTVLDAVPGGDVTLPAGSVELDAASPLHIPVHPDSDQPSGWHRMPVDGESPYVTVFGYDQFGPSDILFCGKVSSVTTQPVADKRWARRWAVHHPKRSGETYPKPEDAWVEEYTFESLAPDGTSQSPVERKVYQATTPEGAPAVVERGSLGASTTVFLDAVSWLNAVEGDNALVEAHDSSHIRDALGFAEFARVKFALDANGRPAKASLLERDANGALLPVGSKEINELVDVRREREIDGNITRQTRNLLGQHMRTYVGTHDESWEGDSTLMMPDSSSGSYRYGQHWRNPDTHADEIVLSPHNMVITERLEYGDDPHDAWLPTVHRRYMSHPRWADTFYAVPGLNSDGHPQDVDGYATVTQYDWRMRPVRVDAYDKGPWPGTGNYPAGQRLSTTLTYLDHLDRPRLVVTYGPGALPGFTGRDPVQLLSCEIPSPASFLPLPGSSTLRPISIVEYLYGLDDNANEVRSYDIAAWGSISPLPYQSEYHYFGRGGHEVFSQRPDGTATITILDAGGRPQSVSTVAVGVATASDAYAHELSRTEYSYDSSGNVVEERRFERIDSQGDALSVSSGNTTRFRTWNWYDTEKRKLATAELGAEGGKIDGVARFAPAGSDDPRPDNPPAAIAGSDPDTIQDPASGITTDPSFAAARIWIYVYDKAHGNLVWTIEPNLSATRNVYDQNNRLTERIENAFGHEQLDRGRDEAGVPRSTQHKYEYGRLTSLATTSWGGAQFGSMDPPRASKQSNHVVFGADIMDEGFNVVSRNNALVGGVYAQGASSEQQKYTLRYNFAGQIAERVDARGVAMRYSYDGLQRLVHVQVGHYYTDGLGQTRFTTKYPGSMFPITAQPANLIAEVRYTYNDRGQLASIDAGHELNNPDEAPARVIFQYDLRGNLIEDVQEHMGDVLPISPSVQYAWSYESTDDAQHRTGRNRLVGIQYPKFYGLNETKRNVTLGYSDPSGATNPLSDRLSRTTELTTNVGGVTTQVARFGYTGGGRRSRLSLANDAILQDLDTDPETPGLEGLDSFGQTLDLHYTAGPGYRGTVATLYRAQYRYDAAGNRTAAKINQAPASPGDTGDSRSVLSTYNRLGQLIGTDVGRVTLNAVGGELADRAARSDTWRLDALGNWNGNAANPYSSLVPETWGRSTEMNGQLANVVMATDVQNRLLNMGVFDDNGTVTSAQGFWYDRAGNLVSDGTYYYQYDAWNRLVQINLAVGNPTYSLNNLTIVDAEFELPYIPGALVKNFAYDGLGRLIRTMSPYPAPSDTNVILRPEHYYYDGVRRIQEIVGHPIFNLETLTQSQNSTLAVLAYVEFGIGKPPDPKGASTTLEKAQLEQLGANSTAYLSREYVWGPGNGRGGVDELLVQFDRNRAPWWVLQDDGGDIVALCDLGGTPDASLGRSAARVVGQWTYDAYGECLTADHLHAFAPLHAGHKGLFLDRLDVGVADATTGEELPRLVPYAHALYQVRNRVYAPQLGRFLQPDPNASGQTLLEAAAYNGRGLGAIAAAFDLEGRLDDGLNLYQYLGSNPWRRSDAMGLSWDPFSMVDDYIAESMGERVAFMERITTGAKMAAYVGAMIVSMLPFPVAGVVADIGASALDGQMPPELQAARKYLGYAQLGAMGVMIGKMAYSALKTAAVYVMRHGFFGTIRNLWNGAKSLARRALAWLGKSCGCFDADTPVWTLRGQVPIQDVQVGDQVLATDEATGELSVRSVVRRFVRAAAPIVMITVATAHGETTLRTTEEHPFYAAAVVQAAYPADADDADSATQLRADGDKADARSEATTAAVFPPAWTDTKPATRSGWVPAHLLKPGDVVDTLSGPGRVVRVLFTDELKPVYNFEIEGLHNYRVGADGLLAHNGARWCPWPKPKYEVNPLHLYRPNKTPIPPDAEDVYARSMFADGHFWGRSSDGSFYRFSWNNMAGENSAAHFSGLFSSWKDVPKEIAELFGR